MNEQFKILFSDKVFSDLQDIPSKVSGRILGKIEFLKTFPFIGKATESGFWHGFQLIVEDYRILYTINETNKTVNIYHIRHGKRYFH